MVGSSLVVACVDDLNPLEQRMAAATETRSSREVIDEDENGGYVLMVTHDGERPAAVR